MQIQSVVAISDNRFLLGDVARKVLYQCVASSSKPEAVIPCAIKPYHMTFLNGKRIAISNRKTVLITDITVAKKSAIISDLHISYVYGLCFIPNVGNEVLLVTRRKKSGSLPTQYKANTGTIDLCYIRGTKNSVDKRLMDGLSKPGGMARLSNDEIAVADKRSVKIYQII